MGVTVTDVREIVGQEEDNVDGHALFLSKKLHSWIYNLPVPGHKNRMHCHSRDETFFCIEGECTIHFPDGNSMEIKPGNLASVTGGTFYYLENTGTGPMVMVGNGSGERAKDMKIDYETRKNSRGAKG